MLHIVLVADINPIPPLTLAKLYWTVAIPQMMYGLELVNLSISMERSLEVVHTTVDNTRTSQANRRTCCPLAT